MNHDDLKSEYPFTSLSDHLRKSYTSPTLHKFGDLITITRSGSGTEFTDSYTGGKDSSISEG